MKTSITDASLALFLSYARDVSRDGSNWSITPMLSRNIKSSKEEFRENRAQLERLGLIETFNDECFAWVRFTAAGIALAAEHGITIEG